MGLPAVFVDFAPQPKLKVARSTTSPWENGDCPDLIVPILSSRMTGASPTESKTHLQLVATPPTVTFLSTRLPAASHGLGRYGRSYILSSHIDDVVVLFERRQVEPVLAGLNLEAERVAL